MNIMSAFTILSPDNGVSAEVPLANTSRAVNGGKGDRLSALEGKIARLEGNRSKTGSKDVSKKSYERPKVNNRELCFDYNSRNGCKRTPTPGGCKIGYKEYAHACAVYVKDKAAYCLKAHPRKDHN